MGADRDRTMARVFLSFLLAALFAVAAAEAQSNPPDAAASAGALSPAEARRALDALEDPAKRQEIESVLRALASAPSATPVPSPAGAAAPAPAAKLSLQPNSLGLQLVVAAASWARDSSQEILATARALSDAPALWRGLVGLAADDQARAEALDAAWRILVALLCAFAAERALAWALRRPLVALESRGADQDARERGRRDYWRLARRIPIALARLALALAPLAAFAAVGALIVATPLVETETTRLMGLELIKAYALYRAIVWATTTIVAPRHGRLRLMHIDDATAADVLKWTRRLAFLTVLGGTLAESAQLLGADLRLRNALVKFDALAIALCVVAIVLQWRAPVAQWLRAREGATGALAAMRNRLADIWHYLAIFVVVAAWLIWALSLHDGLSRSLQIVVVTAAILIAGRLVEIVTLGLFDRALAAPAGATGKRLALGRRATRYAPPLRAVIRGAVSCATLAILLEVWGVDAWRLFSGDAIGGRLVSALITIGLAVAIAAIIWESADDALERRLDRLARETHNARSARLRTLAPIFRSTLLVVILTVVGLTALSEVGVNVGPLLAGAGIIGIAIGFGSQKLVQDVITGIFLLVENAIQVGDWVTVAGVSGSVEALSIRSMRLRAGDGSVHIVPFSSVTSVTNANRGFGNAAVAVSVAFEEDTDRVGEALSEIAAEMRGNPKFKSAMLSDLQLWGVDKIDGVSATLVGQIVCTDSGRWDVQREFNRRMKRRFAELGIRMVPAAQSMVFVSPPSDAATNGEERERTVARARRGLMSPGGGMDD